MARVVLISPPSPHRDFPDPEGLPLGLAMLAAMVREKASITVIDAYSRALSPEEAAVEAQKIGPDLVGIGLPFSFTERPGLEIAHRLKIFAPDLSIIMGGIAATLRADELLKDPAVDAVALGEAEETFVEVLDSFLDGGLEKLRSGPPAGLRTIGLSGVPIGERRRLVDNLDTLPLPALDLVPGFPASYSARILPSRGCRFHCPYCASAGYWGNRFRARSPRSIVAEMRLLRDRWGVRRVSFADDTFNQDPKWAGDVAEALIDADLGMQWGTSCRAELLSYEDLDLFAKAGMTGLFLGLESGSRRILKTIRRQHDLDATSELIGKAELKGIAVHASFMIGLPEETAEDVELTLAYARRIPASSLGFHIFHPLPGSEIGDDPERYGIEWSIPAAQADAVGAIDGVAPIRTRHLGTMEILDYYYRGRGIAEERRRGKTQQVVTE